MIMVPHHGSKAVNHAALIDWTAPQVAVACQLPPRYEVTEETYEKASVSFLSTAKHGAVTIRSRGRGFVVETYRSKERWMLETVPD